MTKSSLPIAYLQKNFDHVQLTHLLAQLTWLPPDTALLAPHQVLLAALRQHDPVLRYQSVAQIQQALRQVDEQHIVALVRALKRQLHQLVVVCLTHAQGDQLYASYLEQHTHNDFEVLLSDAVTGDCWPMHMQAHQQTSTLKDWRISSEDQFIAASELATQLHLERTALGQKALTQSVEDAIDFIVTAKDPNDEHFWDYFPVISVASVSLAIFELFQRYQKQDISWSEFKWMAAKISGIKVSKIAFIGLLLGLPVVGQVTGAYLVAKLLLTAKATWFEKDAPLYKVLRKIQKPPTSQP